MGRPTPSTPRASVRRTLRLDPLEQRLLLAAPVLIDSHTYADGVTVSVYDTNGADGVSSPDIAWDASQYVTGVTDVYVNPGVETDGIVTSISVLGDGADTDDLGIAIEGHSLLGVFQDVRTGGDNLGFFASTARVDRIITHEGFKDADLNGFTLAGGTTFGADIDGDGDALDRVSIYVDGHAPTVWINGGMTGDAVITGNVTGFEIFNGLAGELHVNGNVGTALVHGEVSGGIVIGRPATTGSTAGRIEIKNSTGTALSGRLDVNGSATAIVMSGVHAGAVEVAGDVSGMVVYGETHGSIALGEPGVSTSDVGTLLLSEWYGQGLAGSLDIWGYATKVIIRGETSGTVSISEGAGAVYTYGETSGSITLGGPTTSMRSPGYLVMGVCGAERSLSGALTIYGDASLVYARGGIQGHVYVTGSVGTLRTNFGLTGSIDIGSGTDDPTAVDVGFLKLMDGANSIGGPVTIHGNATKLEFVGRTTADLTVEGDVTKMTLIGEGGPSTGNVDIQGGLMYSVSSGVLEGDWAIGGNITRFVHYGEIAGTFTVNGDTATKMVISNWGQTALSGDLVAPNTDVTRLYVLGDLTGSFDINNSYMALVAGGRVANPGNTAMRVRGDATYLKVYDYAGPEAAIIEGDVQVDGHLYMFYLRDGNFDGALNLNSVDSVKYHAPAGLTATVNIAGDVGRLEVSQAPISGTVNVGGLARTIAAPKGISGTVNLNGGLADMVAYGPFSGTVNVTGNAGNFSLGASNGGSIHVDGDIGRVGVTNALNTTITSTGTISRIKNFGDWLDSTLDAWQMGSMYVYGVMGDPDTHNARDDVIRVHDAASRFDIYNGATKYILRSANPYEPISGADAILG